MALLGHRPPKTAPTPARVARVRVRAAGPWPGLALAASGVAVAWGIHRLLPGVPMLTVAIVLGLAAAQLPGTQVWVRGWARPGLTFAAKRLMRVGVVLLGLKLSLRDVLGVGLGTVAMVLVVVAATFFGTWWLGLKLGLPGDQPLLIATGYSICGASAIGAVSDVSRSEERDTAASVAVVTLCGTLAIAVLPLLQGPLGLSDAEFGRWVGASVHDVGQVVATAQTAGGDALGEGVLVKLMRVAMLAPLVAGVALAVRARSARGAGSAGVPGERRPPLVPLFVAGFVGMVAVRSTGWLPDAALDGAGVAQELLLAAALFGLGSAVDLRSLVRTGGRVGIVGLFAWVVVGGVSYAGVCLTG
ncbi:YeiH family protein [Streptomyces aureocirculatus]|uniref:YeiH family protein n=1 Tax=Streptomyces aureocirculatus TaxID=67275 RepID=UPI0004C60F1F|nr:putative sulfate exporter family transporter [Streptomyces aureocirculatus]